MSTVTDPVARLSQHSSGNGMSNAIASDDKEANSKGNASQVKSGKRKGATKFSVNEVAEDEYVSGKGLKSKKKGGKGKGGNSELGSLSKGGRGNIEKQVTRGDEVLSEDYISSRILENFPDLEGVGTGNVIICNIFGPCISLLFFMYVHESLRMSIFGFSSPKLMLFELWPKSCEEIKNLI